MQVEHDQYPRSVARTLPGVGNCKPFPGCAGRAKWGYVLRKIWRTWTPATIVISPRQKRIGQKECKIGLVSASKKPRRITKRTNVCNWLRVCRYLSHHSPVHVAGVKGILDPLEALVLVCLESSLDLLWDRVERQAIDQICKNDRIMHSIGCPDTSLRIELEVKNKIKKK